MNKFANRNVVDVRVLRTAPRPALRTKNPTAAPLNKPDRSHRISDPAVTPSAHSQKSRYKSVTKHKLQSATQTLRTISVSKIAHLFRTASLKQKLAYGVVAMLLLGGVLITENSMSNTKTPIAAAGTTTGNKQEGPTRGTPTYGVVEPAGKDVEMMGGWYRISPPDRNPVYAYTDKIGSSPINVSQQPLPKDFYNDINGNIKRIAKELGATEGTKFGKLSAYIGTASNQSQSVVFHKDDLLILIKSNSIIKAADWADYVNSLQ